MTHEGTSGDQDPAMRATGAALRDYLDENAESKDSLSHFTNGMARLLADRIDGSPDGVVPEGYVMATQLLIYDCKDTGTNGFTGEPMPRDVTGQPPMMYGLFQSRSVELAREVFGDPFAAEVDEVYTSMKERMQAAKEGDESAKKPKLTAEQIDSAFARIASGDIGGLEPIEKEQAYDVLKKVEGVDPVEAILDDQAVDIPEEGWIVRGDMRLGSSAVIDVFRYNQNAQFSRSLDSGDTREKQGSAQVSASLKGYTEHNIVYESPDFPQAQRDMEPYERTSTSSYTSLAFDRADLTDLSNGGRIVDTKEPRHMDGGYGPLMLGWDDMDRLAERNERNGSWARISRVTDDPETVRRIVAEIGYAMGMDGQGLEAVSKLVEAKDQGQE